MLTTVEKVLFLMRAPATAEVSTDALARLASVALEEEVGIGTRLFASGDEAETLYFILDGAVRIEGHEGLRLAEASELLGGLALLAGLPHSATATAVGTTRILRVERDDLNDLLDEDGEFAHALFSGLVRSLAVVTPSLVYD